MNSILVVDDHILFREGLLSIIKHWEDFQVVGEAVNGKDALEKAHELLPDIILMDINMPGISGIEATRRITRELPSIRVVILTMSDEEDDLFNAIKCGAQGYVLKNTPSKRLHDELRGAMRGETPISGVMATKVLEEFNRLKAGPRSANVYNEPLSEREIQVLELIVQGLSNAEIAEKTFLSENTVKKHLRNILDKLHLNNRVEAAVYAIREGLVD